VRFAVRVKVVEVKSAIVANYTTGGLVAILYAVFICLLFGGFSSYISRVTLGKDLASDVGSLDTVIYRASREADLKQKLENANENHTQLMNEFFTLDLKQEEMEAEHWFKSTQMIQKIMPLSSNFSTNADILADKFLGRFQDTLEKQDYEISPFEKAQMLIVTLSSITFIDNAPAERRDEITQKVIGVLSAVSELQTEVHRIEADRSKLRDQRQVFVHRATKEDMVIESLKQDISAVVVEDEHKAIIASFKNSLWGIPYYLIQIPTIILTLMVTIAAGGLGSVVAFTRKFMRGFSGTGPGRLFVNVGEGVAAAVAIFLFAGAGMLMLTQGAAGAEERVELSPYMVAFIAFVSGFMAEDAFLRIQIAGAKMFQAEGQGD
jgi:hypothetical protein